jgi:hypothetical protein
MKHILLYLGPLLNLASAVPYVIDVVRLKTKPNIVSWSTWSLLTTIGTISVMTQAGFVAGLLPLSATLCTLSVVLLGSKYGFAKYTKADAICQLSAIFGLVLWLVFDSPMIALIAVIVIDAIACIPTVLHAIRSPQEETWIAFAISSFASLLTFLSINTYTAAKIAYPVFLTLGNALIATIMIVMRRKKGLSLSRK